jgi:CheY-like chemotaxis protein
MSQVLLIEDDPDTGESLQAMLEALGHGVTWVRSGLEAVAFLRKGSPPDLVLTDIVMPDMDGLESVQYFKAEFPHIPVLAMSAQRDVPYLRVASLLGARETLHKPFTLADLRGAIERVQASL